ncbi:uroporphyrinogen-III C-methyltransferase [Parvibaculum sp.]|uniref:uroporphyrinogen-III C-methyltransferase n=1 Tax=Parvibaculum sp. TaxID=2024848 RepID=UPI0034A045DE
MTRRTTGHVSFVGAGPGDPELLTLRALRLLQAADIVLYDALVSAEILALTRAGAQRVSVGKRAGGHSMSQDEINTLLVRLARRGRHVLRLKGGDPAIFGRLGEEIDALRAAGIGYDIVPGITAASAAAAAAGVTLTRRGAAHRLEFVAGQRETGTTVLPRDSAGGADATLAIYMARKAAAGIARDLIAAGRAPETPALVMSDIGRGNEVQLRTDLRGLGKCVAALPAAAPLIVLVGEALDDAACRAFKSQARRDKVPDPGRDDTTGFGERSTSSAK